MNFDEIEDITTGLAELVTGDLEVRVCRNEQTGKVHLLTNIVIPHPRCEIGCDSCLTTFTNMLSTFSAPYTGGSFRFATIPDGIRPGDSVTTPAHIINNSVQEIGLASVNGFGIVSVIRNGLAVNFSGIPEEVLLTHALKLSTPINRSKFKFAKANPEKKASLRQNKR
eukprot:TRINITY_DN1885_c0_g1_i1.p1 TRINITY_DN1885_c0_g1~~TRINITY_DN1885_c0_g1_i1.p1  ORF type:complete len:168 (-),score=16.39 TRINITY_DN1885_c0_g1_i1:15-518(-)